jgi:AcrR family transcriptional regulator
MAKKPEAETSSDAGQRIVKAAQALLADTPWHRIALADIALRAGVPLSELYRRYPLRPMLMAAVLRAIDMQALDQPIETEGSLRERLLESLMRRLDALAPFREGMRATSLDLRRLNLAAVPDVLMTAIHGNYVLGWYIEAAGIPVHGLTGLARVKLVSLAWVSAFKTWLDDDSEDSGRSMAALDRALGRIWSWMHVDEPLADTTEAGEDPMGDPQPIP